MKPFIIHFPEEEIADLRRRLETARLPDPWPGSGWAYGTDAGFLKDMVAQWRTGYDWSPTEAALNRWPQYTCEIDGTLLHFFHIKSRRKDAPALILTHGWPDSFLRYVKLFPLLPDYDLVVPSLPGFGFSRLPEKGFLNNAEIAELWYRLMTEVLGYPHFVASGGDVGRGVTQFLAQEHPEAVIGIHLTDAGFARDLMEKPDAACTDEERDYKRRAAEWVQREGAYINIQGTKPQTLAYALVDSPVALAAWLTEKYHAWSDWERFQMNDLLDSLTLYWLTRTGATSVRVYHANTFTLPALLPPVRPVTFTHFAYDVLPVPRSHIERTFRPVRYDEVPRGGHFTALEQPEAFAESIRAAMSVLLQDSRP